MNRRAFVFSLVIVGCGGPGEVATTTDAVDAIDLGADGSLTTSVNGNNYTIISSSVDPSVKSPLRKIDTLVQVGSDTRNRFYWHKVYRPNSNRRGAIVIAPTAYSDFDMYMVGPQGQSLAEVLASNRYEVHGYSTRQALLAPNACSSGAVDCSILGTWGYQAHADDLDFIRKKAGGKPAVGGISSGAGYSLAAVNAKPDAWAGLFLGEMLMTSSDPFILGWGADVCATYTDYINAGATWDDGTQAYFKSLTVSEARYATFAGSNLEAYFGVPGLRINVGMTSLTYASWTRIKEWILGNPDQETLAMLRDEACAWAGDDQFTDRLGNFTAPVLALRNGVGMGPYMQPTIDLLGSTQVTVVSNPAYGHLDAYPGRDDFAPALVSWLGTLSY